MQIGSLDIPEEILTALEEKRLVIFAGAGVSIPPPAGLPSFRGLVEDIVGRDPLPDEMGQMDRVLGRAKEQGVPIHRRVAELLTQPDSRFNSLHENLVALFGSAAAVRIVTTNFDQHFQGAIAVDPGTVETYIAPALPMGSSFTGLAHLHGALGRAPEELMLTDADFGRAYLTEGWARRFVVELFREYTVLFVGYSYGDTVMSYLTRGLAPTFGRQRFALTESGQREKWELLGIQPIEYDAAGDHRELAEGLEQWVRYERRGFLDWSQRLSALVERGPRALAPDEQGELAFCLRNPKRGRMLYEHAKHPDWLKWAEEHGRLQPLFSFEGDQEQLRDLALWFTEDPLGSRGKVALQIALKTIRPVGGALSVLASQQVYRALAEGGVIERAEAQRAAAWATLLTERTAPGTSPAYLAHWMAHLSPQDHPQLTVQILAHLLRCEPMFREGRGWGQERELGLSLDTRRVADDLSYIWSKLRPHIGALAWPLVPVITEVLEARWRWMVSLESATPLNDPWGWDRSWVERLPDEDSMDDAIDEQRAGPLLDIGKDVLDELVECAAEKAAVVIELWLAASAPQLVQLGLYGLAKSSHWKLAKKLEKLVAKHLPAKMPFKVEVFRVLREAYPQLRPRQRERFLKRTERLYRREIEECQDDPAGHRSAVYEWFNVLVWLTRAAPGDPLLDQATATVLEIYPEFQPRDHPELDIGPAKGGWVRPESRLNSEEITRLSLSQWRAELAASVERKRREFTTDHVNGFLEETARAASEHLEWGLPFARGLLESGDFDHQVWPPLLNTWGDHAFRPGEWTKLLRVLDHPELLSAQTRSMTELVRGRAKQKDPEASLSMLRSSLRLAAKILVLAEDIPFSILSENEDWLLQAINHPGGQLAEFLILATGQLLDPNKRPVTGIPRSCRPLLEAMMVGTGRASAMGRVVIASHVHYFFQLDTDWTKDRLLPLFDWDRDATQAVQAWHGFLFWGRLGAMLLEALTPTAVQLSSHVQELGGQRKHYGKFIARGAFSVPDDPLEKAWFQAFLTRASDDDRAYFTWELDKLLESLRPEQKDEIWRDWLKRYLERRAQFPPAPEGKELSALFGWSFNLPEQLAELVECLEALPGGGSSDQRLIWKLEKGELTGADPNLLARLTLALLKRCDSLKPWELSPLRAVIERLIDENANAQLIRDLAEKYLENGGPEHQDLLVRLKERGR